MKTNNAVTLLVAGFALGLAPAHAKGGGGAGASAGAHGMGNGPAPSSSSLRPTPSMDRPDNANAASEHANPNSAAPDAQQLVSSIHDINQTAFKERRQLLDSVDMRLKSSRDALRRIQSNAREARADAHGDFKASLDEAKLRDRELDAAVKASRDANEANWEARRTALAQANERFNVAMTRLEAVSPPLPKP